MKRTLTAIALLRVSAYKLYPARSLSSMSYRLRSSYKHTEINNFFMRYPKESDAQ